MTILWDKKLIRFSDGSYIAWGLKRKKFFFANKNELKLNCAIIEYYEEREKCDKKVISDLNKIIAELEKENAELKEVHESDKRSLALIAKKSADFEKANETLKSAVKVLISTLDDTLWDEGHPGYSDSEPGYNCPECACKDCYRVSCKYNTSELFKKLNTDFPELFKKGE